MPDHAGWEIDLLKYLDKFRRDRRRIGRRLQNDRIAGNDRRRRVRNLPSWR